MKNTKNTHVKENNTTNTSISHGKKSQGKYSIVLLGIGILAIAIVGYSYYDGSNNLKSTYSNTTSKGTCVVGGNDSNTQGGGCNATKKNSTTTTTKGGCACCSGKKKIQTTTNTTNTTINPNVIYETVNIGHDGRSTSPEITILKVGKNYKLVITPTSDGKGCMSNLTIPSIDNNVYDIIKGQAINIVINNVQKGSYDIVCGNMGMYQGKIVVK